MTDLPAPYGAIVAALRGRAWPDGGLLAVFLNRARHILLAIEIGEGTHHVDELFLRHLVAVVTDIGVAHVALAIPRVAGRPTRIDKVLWHDLSDRLAGTSTDLLDVVVIGESRWWSAASGRGAALPAQSLASTSPEARCPERTAPSM